MRDFLYHKKNALGKIESNYKRKGVKFRHFFNSKYTPYLTRQQALTGNTRAIVNKRAKLLDEYLQAVDSFNTNNWITQQSKFKSTVLEEFCGFLLKDLPGISDLELDIFNKGVYAGLQIDQEGKTRVKTKDIDFCIGKEVSASFNREEYKIIIPVVAAECKTYLDNTMFSEAQFTAQKIKQGAPNVKVFVIAEVNEVGLGQIPAQSPVDQVYILRKNWDSSISSAILYQIVKDAKRALEKIEQAGSTTFPGVFFKNY